MHMTGPDSFVRISARPNPNNYLVDKRPMDEDEHLDFADQEPLPSPTVPTPSMVVSPCKTTRVHFQRNLLIFHNIIEL
jgi:hypothetical protein